LVVEVEHALVREYPSHGVPGLDGKQQPLLLVSLLAGPQWPREAELMPLVAPPEFQPGDPIGFFDGHRLLDRPVRTLRGRRLEIRLLENNRTAAPAWQTYAEAVSHAGVGALSALGMPGPPSSVVDAAVALLVRLDRDSLILLWALPLDQLLAMLDAAEGDVLRFPLASTRATPAGPGRGAPSAELSLLVYREPEVGCLGPHRSNQEEGHELGPRVRPPAPLGLPHPSERL